MAQSQQKPRRFAPRPATDPQRWSRVSGGVLPRRARQTKPSGMQKVVGMLGGGGKANAGKSGRRGGAAGGVAMLTTVAGLAYRNRDKLAALMNRRGGGQPAAGRQ
jgi:hypothetical protein